VEERIWLCLRRELFGRGMAVVVHKGWAGGKTLKLAPVGGKKCRPGEVVKPRRTEKYDSLGP